MNTEAGDGGCAKGGSWRGASSRATRPRSPCPPSPVNIERAISLAPSNSSDPSKASYPSRPSKRRKRSATPIADDLAQHTAGPWHYIKDGENSAAVIQQLEERKTSVSGFDERDVFGANPLHLATLFSKTPRFQHAYVEKKKRQEEEERLSRKEHKFFKHDSMGWEERAEHEEITMAIWRNERLEQLQTQAYDRTSYEGETAIHLAIAKRRGDLVEKFLDSLKKADKAVLINSRAVGTFDVAHFVTTDGIKRCKLGEHPVCWAACTNQRTLVQKLLKHGADLECRTRNGDSILHMLVRWSGWLEERRGNNVTETSATNREKKWLLDMYDFIEGLILKQYEEDFDRLASVPEKQQLVKCVVQTKNDEGLTPLLLAASKRVASKKMFKHLIKKHIQTLWIFGPFRGISMDVASIDPMVHSLPGKGPKGEISQKSSEETVLSLLAREQNTELISNKYVQALLDTKWDKYAQEELLHRLSQTVLMLLCLIEAQLIPVTEDSKLFKAFGINVDFSGDGHDMLLCTWSALQWVVSINIAMFLFTSHKCLMTSEQCFYVVLFILLSVLHPYVASHTTLQTLDQVLTSFLGPFWGLLFLVIFGVSDLSSFMGSRHFSGLFFGFSLIMFEFWGVLVIFFLKNMLNYAACLIDSSWSYTEGLSDRLSKWVDSILPRCFTREKSGRIEDCILDNLLGQRVQKPSEHYDGLRLSPEKFWIEVTFYVVCFCSTFVHYGFATFHLKKAWQDVWGVKMVLPLEFSLWQCVVFFHVIPWAIDISIRSHGSTARPRYRILVCFLVFIIMFGLTACFRYDTVARTLDRMFGDDIQKKEEHCWFHMDANLNEKEGICKFENFMIHIVSMRTKSAVWMYLLIGTGFMSWIEFRQLLFHCNGNFNFIGLFNYWKTLKNQSRLQMLQNLSSFSLFPCCGLMFFFHLLASSDVLGDSQWPWLATIVGDKPFEKLEFLMSILLTGFLLVRLLIYLLGVEQAAQNLLVLFEAPTEFLVVFVFYFVLHSGICMVRALNFRFHFEQEMNSATIRGEMVNGTILAVKYNATNEFASYLGDVLKNMLDPSSTLEKQDTVPGSLILNLVSIGGLTMVPFFLYNLILATLMGKKGEEYRERAEAMWKMARCLIIMSIDEEIIAAEDVKTFFNLEDEHNYKAQRWSYKCPGGGSFRSDADWHRLALTEEERQEMLQILYRFKNKNLRGRESRNSESHDKIHIREKDGTEWDFNFEYMTCKRTSNVLGCEKMGNTIDFRVVEEKFLEVRCDWLEFDDETNQKLEAKYLQIKRALFLGNDAGRESWSLENEEDAPHSRQNSFYDRHGPMKSTFREKHEIPDVKLKVWNAEQREYVLLTTSIQVSFDKNMFWLKKHKFLGDGIPLGEVDDRGYKIMRLDHNDKSYFQEITNNDGNHHTWAVNLTLKAKVPPEDICNYMRHPTQFYTCKKTSQPLEESNSDLLPEAPLLDLLTNVVGKDKAQKILSQMQEQDVTKDVLKYLNHEAWQELGVTSGIQQSKIMEAVSNMSFEQSANKEPEPALVLGRRNRLLSIGGSVKVFKFAKNMIEGGRRASERNRKAKEPAESSDTHA